MDKSTTVAEQNYQEDNYSNKLAHSVSQLNVSTLMPSKSTLLGDIEYNEFNRRWLEFSIMMMYVVMPVETYDFR